jgi:hypothetical protein
MSDVPGPFSETNRIVTPSIEPPPEQAGSQSATATLEPPPEQSLSSQTVSTPPPEEVQPKRIDLSLINWSTMHEMIDSQVNSPAIQAQFKSDPKIASEAIDTTRAEMSVSKVLGLPLDIVHGNLPAISEAMYGKPLEPKNIFERVSNLWNGMKLSSEYADLYGKKYLGDDSKDTQDSIEETKKKLQQIGPAFGWVGETVLGVAHQLLYQGWYSTKTVADYGLAVLSGELLSKALGWNTYSNFLEFVKNDSSRVFGSLVGGSYGALIDRGVDPKYARVFAGGLGAMQIALLALPMGEAITKPVLDAVVEGTFKTILKGAVDELATTVPGRLAIGATRQTLFAAGMSAANTGLPEVAASLSNRFAGTNVQLKSPGELATEFGKGTLGQAIAGMVMVGSGEALRTILQPHIEAAVNDVVDKVMADEIVKEPPLKIEPVVEPVVEHPITTATKELPQTIGDILENKPTIPVKIEQPPIPTEKTPGQKELFPAEPKVTPQEPTKLTKAQGEALDLATLREDNAFNYIEQDPQIVAMNKKIEDLTAKIEQGKTQFKEQLDQAKADKVAAVKSLRFQIKQRTEVNGYLKDIASIDPKYMNRDLGDQVRAIQKKFSTIGKTTKEGLTPERLDEIKGIHDALSQLDEETGAPLASPYLDMERLSQLPAISLRDLPVEDIRTVRDAILNLNHIQKTRDMIQNGKDLTERAAYRRWAENHVMGYRPDDATQFRADHGQNPNLDAGMAKLWKDSRSEGNAYFSGYSFNAESIFGGKDNPLYEIVAKNVIEAEAREETHTHRLESPVYDDWLKDKMKINRRINLEKYTNYANEQFNEDGFTLNRGEIMSAWMDFQEPNQKASRLSGSGIPRTGQPENKLMISENTFNKFFTHIKPEIEMMSTIAAEQLQKAGDERGAEFEARYGYPMPRVKKGYWPKFPMREGANYKVTMEELQKDLRYVWAAPNESRSIARTGAIGPMYLRNFFDVFHESLADTAHVVEMGPVIEQAAKILFDKKIETTIIQRKGAPLLRMMRDDLKWMAGQARTAQGYENAMDNIGNVLTTMNLTPNIKSGIKQAMLGLRSYNVVRDDAWGKAMAHIAAHPAIANAEAMAMSDRYSTMTRRGGTIEQTQLRRNEMNLGGNRTLRKVLSLRTMMGKAGMFFNKEGTRLSYLIDVQSAKYHTQIEVQRAMEGKPFLSDDFRSAAGVSEEQMRAMNNGSGPTPGEQLTYAGRFGDMIIGETHASSIRGQQVGIQKFSATRLLTKFMTEPLKAFEVQRRVIMQAYRNPTAFNVYKAVKTMVFYTIAEGAAFFGLDTVWNIMFGNTAGSFQSQEKRKPTLLEEEAKANLNYIPGVGQIVTGAMTQAKYPNAYTGNVGGQVGSTIQTSLVAIGQYLFAKSERQRERAGQALMDGMMDLGSSVLLKVSPRPIRNMIRGIVQRVGE